MAPKAPKRKAKAKPKECYRSVNSDPYAVRWVPDAGGSGWYWCAWRGTIWRWSLRLDEWLRWDWYEHRWKVYLRPPTPDSSESVDTSEPEDLPSGSDHPDSESGTAVD